MGVMSSLPKSGTGAHRPFAPRILQHLLTNSAGLLLLRHSKAWFYSALDNGVRSGIWGRRCSHRKFFKNLRDD